MGFFADLRYGLPLLINLGKPWFQNPNLSNEIFVSVCLFLAIAILLFLFISVKLRLSVESIHLRAGDFSTPLTLAFLASLFFSQSTFWYVFPIIVILSPWYEMLLDLLKRFIFRFSHTLQAIIPVHFISCIAQPPHDEPEETDLEANEVEGNNEAIPALSSDVAY